MIGRRTIAITASCSKSLSFEIAPSYAADRCRNPVLSPYLAKTVPNDADWSLSQPQHPQDGPLFIMLTQNIMRQSVSNKQQQAATSSNSIHAKHFRPDKESTSAGRSWNEWQKSGNAAWQKLRFGIIYAISPPHRLWLALVEQHAGSRLELQLNFSL